MGVAMMAWRWAARPRWHVVAAAIVAAAMAAVVAGIGATTIPAEAGTAGSVAIRRTEFGIPHVLAGTYRDLGYGAGYAYAQDNLCALADDVLTVSGERSRWFGPDASAPDGVGNLDSDVYYAALGESGIVESILARPQPLGPSPRARDLMRGYAAGVDAYLARQGVANLPDPTCRGAGWVR